MRKKIAIHHPALWCGLALAGAQLTLGAATLTNRYNFNEASGTSAADSVGGQDGTLMNSAFFTGGGQAYLGSFGLNSTDPSGDYIRLPDNLVTGHTAITVETWYTPTHNSAAFADWNRIWDFWNPTAHFFCRSGNNTFGIGGDITTASGSQGIFGPTVPDSVESHVAWTSDPATGIAALYVNGVRVATVTGFTNTPAAVGATTNNWLGRAKYPDPYLQAYFNEFRIYGGALNPFEVVASFESGADTPSTDYGSVTNIELVLPSTLLLGNSQLAQVLGSASGLITPSVDITGLPGLAFESDDTGVLTVNAAGNVNAVALGSATITATYVLDGVTNTSSQLISVISVPATLKHRYSFTNDSSFTADDSVGGAHGTLMGSAIQSGGKATLDGLGGTYVDLPANMISSSTISNNAITFETWASFGVNPDWVNLFAFGNTVGNDGGNYLFFGPHSGVADYRVIVSSTMPGWNGGEQGAFAPGNLDNQTNVHVACVVNFGRDQAAIYVNGVRVAQNTAFARELANIVNNYSYLGRSTYPLDPYLVGEIDEFRIYDGALSAQQIAASAQTSGPNSTNLDPGSFVGISLVAPASLPAGWQSTGVSVIAEWQFATNVNLIGDLDLSLSSSDTNVATISAAGVVTALAPGTTTLSATYQGNTSMQLLTVVNPTATLKHRYSFNETEGSIVPDLVGGAHGTVSIGTNTLGVTNAAWTGTGLIINTNTTLGAQDTYVDLPDGIISALTNNASFEMWVTAYTPGSDYWIRVFDVGSLPGPPFPSAPNIYFSRGGRFDWSLGAMDAGAFPSSNAHVVVLYNDEQNQAKIYVNGNLAVTSAAGAVNLALNSITDTNVWLGRSLYSAPISTEFFDPYLQAEYDEFRIYSGLLTPDQIMGNFLTGPNPALPSLSFTVGGGNLNLLWPTNAVGFAPMMSPLLGTGASWSSVPGTPATSGTNYMLSIPMTNAAGYFRLQN